MDAALLQDVRNSAGCCVLELGGSSIVSAAEFRKLLVSHRRMVRVDRRDDRLRGLQDLDTGEIFLTDERRLVEAR